MSLGISQVQFSALPTGASTEATLVAVSGKLPATLGTKTMANSLAITIASDQSTLPVSLASVPSHPVTNAGTFAVQADTELPAAAALADASANPTTPTVGSALLGFNGATWDRLRSTIANGLLIDVSRVQGTVAVTGPLTDTQLRASVVPVSLTSTTLTGTSAISAASLPLPTGASTETTLAAVSGKLPATLAQKTMANSLAVVLASDQSSIPVTLSSTTITGSVAVTGPLTDTQLRASAVPVSLASTTVTGTVAVSAASLPLPTGASTETTLAAVSGKLPATLAQKTMANSLAVVLASDQSSIPVTLTSTTLTGTSAVSAASLPLPTGAATETSLAKLTQTQGSTTSGQSGPLLQGAVTTAAPAYTTAQTSPLSLTTAGAVREDLNSIAGTTVLTGNGVTGAGSLRVTLASDTSTNTNALNIQGPTLTKGTQGATGLSVQKLNDAGRVAIAFSATNVASGTTTTETAITLVKSAGTAATSSAASFVVTSGKRFRITSIVVAARGNATATAQITKFNFRLNAAGAVTTASTPVLMSFQCATPATASAYDRFMLPISEGYEILGDGTLQIGITAAATFVTNAPTWDVFIVGYEY